jgi:cytochrome b6-f complex iron-sulfur subunit
VDSENNPTPPGGGAQSTPTAQTESTGESSVSSDEKTPVTPSAKAASTGTSAPAASDAAALSSSGREGVETPASTPPAARVAPATGASKTASSPTPSVNKGVPKAVAARTPGAVAAKQPGAVVQSTTDPPINKMRRRIVWASITGFLGASFLMFLRFFLPRAIFEPSSIFRIGFPGDYSLGVDTKWQQLYRIWVVKTSDRLFVINAVCTHLGCTPDWKSSENKFKCPCHGSGYDSDGINFEGPAPRPMDRAHIEVDAEGQLVVDKGKLYKAPKGERNEFNDDGSFVPL